MNITLENELKFWFYCLTTRAGIGHLLLVEKIFVLRNRKACEHARSESVRPNCLTSCQIVGWTDLAS